MLAYFLVIPLKKLPVMLVVDVVVQVEFKHDEIVELEDIDV